MDEYQKIVDKVLSDRLPINLNKISECKYKNVFIIKKIVNDVSNHLEGGYPSDEYMNSFQEDINKAAKLFKSLEYSVDLYIPFLKKELASINTEYKQHMENLLKKISNIDDLLQIKEFNEFEIKVNEIENVILSVAKIISSIRENPDAVQRLNSSYRRSSPRPTPPPSRPGPRRSSSYRFNEAEYLEIKYNLQVY
jgi:hypothetical protein